MDNLERKIKARQHELEAEFANLNSFTTATSYSTSYGCPEQEVEITKWTNRPARNFAKKLKSAERRRLKLQIELMSFYRHLDWMLFSLGMHYGPKALHYLNWPDQWPELPENWPPTPADRYKKRADRYLEKFENLAKEAQEYSDRVNRRDAYYGRVLGTICR